MSPTFLLPISRPVRAMNVAEAVEAAKDRESV
jgi:hypothetical protein